MRPNPHVQLGGVSSAVRSKSWPQNRQTFAARFTVAAQRGHHLRSDGTSPVERPAASGSHPVWPAARRTRVNPARCSMTSTDSPSGAKTLENFVTSGAPRNRTGFGATTTPMRCGLVEGAAAASAAGSNVTLIVLASPRKPVASGHRLLLGGGKTPTVEA